eukprot:12931868-Prorocentrum_lima.AAC.1
MPGGAAKGLSNGEQPPGSRCHSASVLPVDVGGRRPMRTRKSMESAGGVRDAGGRGKLGGVWRTG